MADVLQSRSPRSVPVGFHLSPLHPRLMYLPLLLRSPVQHAMAQQGSLLRARDVEDWQLSVDRGVNCARFAWFFTGHHRSWWSTFIPCLPALVRVIIITVVVSASLSTSGPAYATATTCAGTAATTCTGLPSPLPDPAPLLDHWLQTSYVVCPRRSHLHRQWSSCPLWCRLPAPDPRCQRSLRPRRF